MIYAWENDWNGKHTTDTVHSLCSDVCRDAHLAKKIDINFVMDF